MADYVSAYSGEQIDTAIGKILAGGGFEKLSTWSAPVDVRVNSDEGVGDAVTLSLTRALKNTDILLVTFDITNASNGDMNIVSQSYLYPGAYSNDVALNLVEDFQDSSSYYALTLDVGSVEVGSSSFTAHAYSYGSNSYGPWYRIFGVYNVSGV